MTPVSKSSFPRFFRNQGDAISKLRERFACGNRTSLCVIYIPDACSANALLVLEITRLLFSKVEGDLTRETPKK